MALNPTYTINGGNTTLYIQGFNDYTNPKVDVISYTTSTGGTTVPTIINEVTSMVYTSLGSVISYYLVCSQPIISYTNDTPDKCSLSFDSNTNTITTTTLQNGVGKVTISTIYGDTQVAFVGSLSSTYSNAYLSAYASGSMAKALHDLVVGAVGSRTTPDPSFMNVNDPVTDFTLNPNQYTKNIIDLTPMTVHVPGVYPYNLVGGCTLQYVLAPHC